MLEMIKTCSSRCSLLIWQ